MLKKKNPTVIIQFEGALMQYENLSMPLSSYKNNMPKFHIIALFTF